MDLPKKDIYFVLLQLFLFVGYALTMAGWKVVLPAYLFWSGLVFLAVGALLSTTAVLQLNVHLSPFPTPLPGAQLLTTGAFAVARHPIYTGIFLALTGYALVVDSLWKLLIAFLILILFYFKASYEEKRLRQYFRLYDAYAARTGMFFPLLRKK